MKLSYDLILASQSPRRSEILNKAGFTFEIIPSNIYEAPYDTGSIIQYVETLALEKATPISQQYHNKIIIGADTIVAIDDKILGKPADKHEAEKMLQFLSGRWHKVITAFSILHHDSHFTTVVSEETLVHFRTLTSQDILTYLSDGSYKDKAGSYGIQDASASFVDRIEGCFYNVVGFPISRFIKTIKNSPFYTEASLISNS